ncbi:MAG TPA: hypothetical protein VFD58_32445 [Blastocatellia bacterium]|nr:hypothetical protein [Blastocatellia bacterium]
MKIGLIAALLILLSVHTAAAQDKPGLSEIDRIRLAEAFRLGETIEDQVWPGWGRAPFAVLLVTPEQEFLIRHPEPSADFVSLGDDALLRSKVWFRKRTYSPQLQATFPAVPGSAVPTIVIGQAENTADKTSTRWVVTLLHEHFHQWQYSQPWYYEGVNALGLSRGDQTGMWMLNYAFPYTAAEVKDHFSKQAQMLAAALQADDRDFKSKLAAYLAARGELKKMLAADDYRYLSFQLWQEGIARYTEYRVAKLAAKRYEPGREFRALKDFTPYAQVAEDILNGLLKKLTGLNLAESQRSAFYPMGAVEGLLLDRIDATWQRRYLTERFSLDSYFVAAN